MVEHENENENEDLDRDWDRDRDGDGVVNGEGKEKLVGRKTLWNINAPAYK